MGVVSIASRVLLISWSIMYFTTEGVAVPTGDTSSPLEPLELQTRQRRHATCGQSRGWEDHEDNCFFFSSNDPKEEKVSWEQAMKNCQDKSNFRSTVTLAVLNDPKNLGSDMWLMERITAKGEKVWLGGRSRQANDHWEWEDGRKLSVHYPLWGPIQPNNLKNSQWCLNTFQDDGEKRMYLNDDPCSSTFHYVCQLPKKYL